MFNKIILTIINFLAFFVLFFNFSLLDPDPCESVSTALAVGKQKEKLKILQLRYFVSHTSTIKGRVTIPQ